MKNITKLTVTSLIYSSLMSLSFTVRGNAADWSMSGQSIGNWRSQPQETQINPSNISTLAPKWIFSTGGDVSATPAVSGGSVYFPDWAGNLYNLNASNGTVNWQKDLSQVTGISGVKSRTTPTLSGNILLVGTQKGGDLIAFNANSGDLLWKTQMDSHPQAILTGSPVVDNGIAYMGISSSEEISSMNSGYPCCTFRGSVAAVNINNGQILWKTYTTLDNGGQTGGYSGNAIWSSAPVVDEKTNSLYATTGNNYDVPQDVKTCHANGGSNCDNPNNYVDSIISLDLGTGALKWALKLSSYDASNDDCLIGGINCPTPKGPDFDFAQGAMLIPTSRGNVLVAGQKSGLFWGVDPLTGKVIWSSLAGPGGSEGGMQWGSATDGKRIYFANANSDHQSWTMLNGQTITGGFWGAIDPLTGEILWETADPNGDLAMDTSSLSVANGVVYAGSRAQYSDKNTLPTFFALNADTGVIVWSYVSGGASVGGPAIVDGNIYWGTGYQDYTTGKIYDFTVDVPEPSSFVGILAVLGMGTILKLQRRNPK